MIKRLFLLTALSVLLSGCFMAPMALVGPAMSGFSTASLNTIWPFYRSQLYGKKKHRQNDQPTRY